MIDTSSQPIAIDSGLKIASGAPRTETVREGNLSRPGAGAFKGGNETVAIDEARNSQSRIQAQKAAQGETAGRIRQAGAFLDGVEEKIDRMNDSLTGIVKHYPPFPPGSEERVQRLESFSAFRKEIERLTFPPEPFGDTIVETHSGETDVSVPPFAFPAMAELGIPELGVGPSEATEEEIHDALESLAKAKGLVDEKRQALQNGAEKVLNRTGSYPEPSLEIRPMDDNDAVGESQNLGSFLKGIGSSLTQSAKSLAELLE